MFCLSQTQINELIPVVLFVLFMIFISFFITKLLAKKQLKYVLIIPAISLSLTLSFTVLAFASNDWSRLGYLIIAAISFLNFVSSTISSLIIYFKRRRNKN